MVRRGYDLEFAKNCFNQIKGFGSYGFPESHSLSEEASCVSLHCFRILEIRPQLEISLSGRFALRVAEFAADPRP